MAVTAIVEHQALDAARDGVKDELKAAGFEAGKNLKYEYQSAQGNTGTAAQIARKYVGDRPDAIVAIATPSAQAVVAATKDIPVVYSAVTDPVAAKLVKSWDASGTNVTGVSDLSPLDKHLELIKQVVPNAKRVGVIYSPGEANSVAIIEALKKAAAAAGLTLVEGAARAHRRRGQRRAEPGRQGRRDLRADRQQRHVGVRGHRQGRAAGQDAGGRGRHRRASSAAPWRRWA